MSWQQFLMRTEHKKILEKLKKYLEQNPDLRFNQALFNLQINQKAKSRNELETNRYLRDNYNDSDLEVINRIQYQLEWFNLQVKVNKAITNNFSVESETVNERLYRTELMDDFNRFQNSNKEFARFILEKLEVDNPSINRILNTGNNKR